MKKIIILFMIGVFFVGYSFAAKLWFETDQKTAVAGCPSSIKVMLDPAGNMTTAMDLKLQVGGVSSLSFDGEGGLFKNYTLPQITSSASTSTLYTLLSTMSRWGVDRSGLVGILTFEPASHAAFVRFSFEMYPGQDVGDSSVIVIQDGQAVDVLTDVAEFLLPVTQGSCDPEETHKTETQKMLENVETGAMLLLENSSYTSPYKSQESRDALMSRVVIHIDAILWVFASFIIALLFRFFYASKLFYKRKY